MEAWLHFRIFCIYDSEVAVWPFVLHGQRRKGDLKRKMKFLVLSQGAKVMAIFFFNQIIRIRGRFLRYQRTYMLWFKKCLYDG